MSTNILLLIFFPTISKCKSHYYPVGHMKAGGELDWACYLCFAQSWSKSSKLSEAGPPAPEDVWSSDRAQTSMAGLATSL